MTLSFLLDLNHDIYYEIMILCIVIVLGLILGKLAEKIGIPAVTGYILAGIIIGPVCGLVSPDVSEGLEIISNIAIGFIAYSIGMELWFPKYKKSAKAILVITVVQAFTTVSVVFLLLIIFKQSLALSLVLAAIACATAPAPIMMIVKRYQTKGPLTDTLLPVVGLDDGIGIIIFGVCLSVAKALVSGGEDFNIGQVLLEPLMELGLSLVVGVAVGLLLGILSNKVIVKFAKHDRNDTYLSLTIISVFISVIVSHYFNLSSILVPMTIGVTVTNMIDKETFKNQTRVIDKFTPPLMIAFFTLAGADLNFSILISAGLVGVIYIVGRVIGKYAGAYISSHIMKSPKPVKHYLGLALFPQGGVAIGMVISAANVLGELGETVETIVLAGIFIFELFGPILVKWSFKRAGEIHLPEKTELDENQLPTSSNSSSEPGSVA